MMFASCSPLYLLMLDIRYTLHLMHIEIARNPCRLRYLAPPSFSKMVMSVCLVAIVFPAWRIYILPTERELSEETTEEGAEKARERL